MVKCTKGPCFYCRIKINQEEKTIDKIICDYWDGEEIKNLPKEKINNCIGYKTEQDMKWYIGS